MDGNKKNFMENVSSGFEMRNESRLNVSTECMYVDMYVDMKMLNHPPPPSSLQRPTTSAV